MSVNKKALRDELLASLSASLELLLRAQEDAAKGATHEEAKAEDDKDTRAIEQSYVARGHAMRIEELQTAVVEVEHMPLRTFKEDQPIALGALVSVSEEESTSEYFMAPHGGGIALSGGTVQVITPKAPLGKALLGKYIGDECEVRVGPRVRELTIENIQ